MLYVWIAVLGFCTMAAVSIAQNLDWRRVLKTVVERYDLKVEGGGLIFPTAHGLIDEMPVTIELRTVKIGDEREQHTHVEMTVPMPTGLAGRCTANRSARLLPWDGAEADEMGLQWQTYALLDVETRAAIRKGLAGGVVIKDGRIIWTMEGKAKASALGVALATMADIARLLTRPVTVAKLADVVRTDTPEFALKALWAMPQGTVRDALFVELTASRSDASAFVAAKRIGADATPCAVRVVQDLANPDALRSDALTWLARHCDATELARAHLKRPAMAPAVLAVLEHAEPPVSLSSLSRLVESGVDAAIPALRAARRLGEPAEGLLLRGLASDNIRVALVAADGLGLVGTPAAVIPLQARLKQRRVDQHLKAAVHAAVNAIQTRASGVAGGLAIARHTAAGRLSEAQPEE